MVEDFPVQGLDYDIATVTIRCRADRFGAQVFRAKQTNGIKELRVLAFDRDEVQQTADCWVHEPIYVSRPAVGSEPSPSYPRGLQACAAEGAFLPSTGARAASDRYISCRGQGGSRQNKHDFFRSLVGLQEALGSSPSQIHPKALQAPLGGRVSL
jgi:hypothetical protein